MKKMVVHFWPHMFFKHTSMDIVDCLESVNETNHLFAKHAIGFFENWTCNTSCATSRFGQHITLNTNGACILFVDALSTFANQSKQFSFQLPSQIKQQTFPQWHAQVKNKIPELSKQTLREETAVIHLQHACACWMSQEERCQQHRTTTRCPLKQGTSFHTWTLNQSGQPRKPAIPSASPTNWNQQLKHPNADSIHTKACFKAIPSGVHKRISNLTTITETNKNPQPDKISTQHFQAPQQAGLITKKVATLTEHASQWRSQSSWTSWGKFQLWTQQKENNLLLCWTSQHLVQTSPLNHQIHQWQVQPPMVESVNVLLQICQP